MFGIIPRYLFGQTLRGVLLALAVVLVLILLVDFVEQTRTVGTRSDAVSLLDFAGLTLLKTPMLVEATLPFILLFGVMLTMFRLNRRSELVVMRASGMSVWRFIGPSLLIAVAAGVASPLALNPLATDLETRFEQRRTVLTGGEAAAETGEEGWFREVGDGVQRMIRAESVNPAALTLRGVTFMVYRLPEDGEPVFARRLDAPVARWEDQTWRLERAVESAPGAAAQPPRDLTLPAYLDTAAFAQDSRAQSIGFWDLPRAADAAQEVGASPIPYRLRLFRLMMTPVLFAAMALIAAAASMRLLRLGGTLQLIVFGGGAAFGAYFLGNLLDAFALNGRLPPALAAAAAPVAATLIALAVIAHLEDA